MPHFTMMNTKFDMDNSSNRAFEELIDRTQLDIARSMNGRTSKSRTDTVKTLQAVDNFLSSDNLLFLNADSKKKLSSAKAFSIGKDSLYSVESLHNDRTNVQFNSSTLVNLAKDCGITNPALQVSCAQALASDLIKFQHAKSSSAMLPAHYSRMSSEKRAGVGFTNGIATYAAGLDISGSGIPSFEHYGASIDTVLPDVRTTMTSTIMSFQRGISDLLLHRRPTSNPHISCTAPYAEIYDNDDANSPDYEVRVHGEHRTPIIGLYHDPRKATTELKPIIPLTQHVNNATDVLIEDGIYKTDTNHNLLDLALDPVRRGYSHVNYTDQISESVIVKSFLFKVTQGSKVEQFLIDVSQHPGSRLVMSANSYVDSGIRGTFMADHRVTFYNGTTTRNGTPSEIFKDCTTDDFITASVTFGINVSIKFGDYYNSGTCTHKATTAVKGSTPSSAVSNLANNIKIEFIGYELDARFSEENMRKSNLVTTVHARTFDYEITNGRNTFTESALVNDNIPEFMMSLITELASIGQDHRNIDMMVRTMLHVYNCTTEEIMHPNMRSMNSRIGFEFIAGQIINPTVYVHNINVTELNNIRSGDIPGDIHGLIDLELQNLMSALYQKSFYRQRLRNEAPVFRVLTSPRMLSLIFAAKHYHKHYENMTNSEDFYNGDTPQRRILDDGTVLELVPHTFEYCENKLVMIPMRVNSPEDILNYGGHWDCGTYVAHYTYQDAQAANNRMFSNTRAMPIFTDVIGCYVEIQGADDLTGLNPLRRRGTVALPDIQKLLDRGTAVTNAVAHVAPDAVVGDAPLGI